MRKVLTVFVAGVIFVISTYALVPTQVLASPTWDEHPEPNLKKEGTNKFGPESHEHPEPNLKKEKQIDKGKHKAKGKLKK